MKATEDFTVSSGHDTSSHPPASSRSSRLRADYIGRAQAALEAEFLRRCPASATLHARAQAVFPGGVTHDNRRVGGPSLFIRKSKGSRKIDHDGNSYVDYWIGHGSLILGHGRREVIEAIHLAAQDVTHPGACHEREVMWAECVRKRVPTAERIRFTASGSEATALAVRLARAMTGKVTILKFEGHFHGWLDHAVEGVDLPFETPFSAGVPGAVRELTRVIPARDLNLVEDAFKQGDIAAVILEPTGASGGSIPLSADFVRGVRELSTRYGVALVFDEVITGFRLSPGGAQQCFDVRPDLTCLAKILAGGMPGGAVCGSREAFAAMEFTGDPKRDRLNRVTQYGTYNANPVCAAAGTATLSLISDDVCRKAALFAAQLRSQLNELFRQQELPWAAYGVSSVFHLLTSDGKVGAPMRDGKLDAASADPIVLKQKAPIDGVLRRALQLEGVDLPPGRQAWVSSVHNNGDLEETINAFSRAIARLRELKCL